MHFQERERRRQHVALIQQLDIRRQFEEREKKKHQVKLMRRNIESDEETHCSFKTYINPFFRWFWINS